MKPVIGARIIIGIIVGGTTLLLGGPSWAAFLGGMVVAYLALPEGVRHD